MSWISDSTELVSGWLSSRYDGHGVLGQNVPSTGGSGPAILFHVLSLPADNNSEFRLVLLSLPSAGVLTLNEDSSFSFTAAPDGQYQFDVQPYKDGVAMPMTITVNLTIGDVNSVSVTINVWNGSAFVPGVLKRWNGSAFVDVDLKRWNGSAFVSVN